MFECLSYALSVTSCTLGCARVCLLYGTPHWQRQTVCGAAPVWRPVRAAATDACSARGSNAQKTWHQATYNFLSSFLVTSGIGFTWLCAHMVYGTALVAWPAELFVCECDRSEAQSMLHACMHVCMQTGRHAWEHRYSQQCWICWDVSGPQ